MTILTLEEFQSLCYSHMHEDLHVDDVLATIEVRSPNQSGKGFLWLGQGIAEAIRTTIWRETIPEWAKR